MKRLLMLFVIVTSSVASAIDVSGIEQGSLKILRATAREDPNTGIGSVAITQATAGDYDSRPTVANGLKIIDETGLMRTNKKYIGVLACARAAADKTFTVNYWLWFAGRGPAIKAVSVDYTTGTQKVVVYPHTGVAVSDSYWADSGTVTSGLPVTIGENASGVNGVKIIVFDAMGADAIYAEVLNADGTTGAEAGDVTVYWFTMSG
jgi:hypothetical protein